MVLTCVTFVTVMVVLNVSGKTNQIIVSMEILDESPFVISGMTSPLAASISSDSTSWTQIDLLYISLLAWSIPSKLV